MLRDLAEEVVSEMLPDRPQRVEVEGAAGETWSWTGWCGHTGPRLGGLWRGLPGRKEDYVRLRLNSESPTSSSISHPFLAPLLPPAPTPHLGRSRERLGGHAKSTAG